MSRPPLSGNTRLFAILGNPVAHTSSPVIQNAAMAARGIDAVYAALRCDADMLGGLLSGIARAGGGGNVTVPHKGLAAGILDRASARVRATHACNTYWSQRGRIYGDNTDVVGFSTAIKEVVADVRGTRALLLGAGGAARAVLYALLEDGCAGVTVLARSRKHAPEIMAVAGRRAARVAYITNEGLLHTEGFDLVINATPLGLRPADRRPLRFSRIGALTAVFDVVYNAGGTRWVNYARSLGIPARDGAEMLVQQAAASFELWFDISAPIDVMRKALAAPIRK